MNEPNSKRESPEALRPEARPFAWERMDAHQQKSFVQIVRGLTQAVNNVDVGSTTHDPLRDVYHVERSRTNHIMLVSGDRGTGKTSLVLTLLRATIEADAWKSEIDSLKQGNPECLERYLEIESAVDVTLKERVLWLDPLDMEMLPDSANLLAGILARVESVVERMGVQHGGCPTGCAPIPMGMLDARPSYEKALNDLSRLAADAALAWDGNIKQRAGQLNADAYGTEVRRSERARLQLNPRVHRVLEAVARQVTWHGRVTNPLLVLPVDDFDLNPRRCLELFRIIRELQVPRLFTLIVGDVERGEEIVQMQLTGNLAKVMGADLDANSFVESPFHARQRSLASNFLRKIVPPSQLVLLKEMSIQEAFDYRPNRGAKPMSELLDFELIWSADAELANQTFRSFLSGAPGEGGDLIEQLGYTGEPALTGPPRHVADLWFTFERHVCRNPQPTAALTDAMVRELHKALADDPMLSVSEQTELQKTVRVNADGKWQLASERVNCAYGGGRWESIGLESSLTDWSSTLWVGTEGSWRFGLHGPGERRPPSLLQGRTRGLMVLAHDLLILGRPKNPLEQSMVQPQRVWFASVGWKHLGSMDEVVVPWETPQFNTFRQVDLFSSLWNAFNLDRAPHVDSRLFLAYAWIAIGQIVMRRAKPAEFFPATAPKWTAIYKSLKQTLKAVHEPGNVNTDWPKRQVQRWLNSLALLMAPESGLPVEFVTEFLSKSGLSEFWTEPENARTIRNVRAWTAAELRMREWTALLYWLVQPAMVMDDKAKLMMLDAVRAVMEYSAEKQQTELRTQMQDVESLVDWETTPEMVSSFVAKLKNARSSKKKRVEWNVGDVPMIALALELVASDARKTGDEPLMDSLAKLQSQLKPLARDFESIHIGLSDPFNSHADGIFCPTANDVDSAAANLRGSTPPPANPRGSKV